METIRERAWLEIAGERVWDGSSKGKWRITLDRNGFVATYTYCGSLSWNDVIEKMKEEIL